MVEVPVRRLRDYIGSLTPGGTAGVVDQNLQIRNDLVTNIQAIPSGGLTGQVLAKVSGAPFDVAWTPAGNGDMLKSMYDPTNIQANAFARSNHTGTQAATTITGLATVATTGQYLDLMGRPAIGTAAAQNVEYFATAAPRTVSVTTTATLTPNADTTDLAAVTAQAGALTIAAPTGTPADGKVLKIRIRDNGTSRALTWNGAYSGYTSDLPAATVVNMTLSYEFWYNASTLKWDLVAGNPIPGKWA